MAEICSHQDHSRVFVSSTAHIVAYIRGLESIKDERLFSDPFAMDLAGEVGKKTLTIVNDAEGADWSAAQKNRFANAIAVRTRVIDNFLLQTLKENEIVQVVVPGAGLDTRPWRLMFPGAPSKIHYFEIDFPEVFTYKLSVLQSKNATPQCQYHNVIADLSLADSWPERLKEAGFDPCQRILWVLEGFVNYLTETELNEFMSTVNSLSSPNSLMIATCVTAAAKHLNINLHRFWPENAADYFAQFGWQGTETDIEDLAATLHRASPLEEERRGYFIVQAMHC